MNKFLFVVSTIIIGAISVQAEKKPNIIMMMADDMGWGDVGFNGNKCIMTPNLDNAAKDGMQLNHFYSVGPVCSPTRAAFLTGRHYQRMGIFSANVGHLPKNEYTISKMFKNAGYTTGHFGKWHLGTLDKEVSSKGKGRKPELNYAPPWERDYDESFVTESAVATWDPAKNIAQYKNNEYRHNGKIVTDNLDGDDSKIIMDRAIPFIENAVNEEKPFMAVIWFHTPHEKIIAGQEYLDMYKGKGEAAHFYGVITAMDDQIGRLRKKLEDLGQTDNTIIFFCSDNGPEGETPKDLMKTRRAGSTGGFKGRKRSLYEGGVRVPAFALYPNVIKAGSVSDEPMSVMDYLPTLSSFSGVKLDTTHPIDGEDISPILTGKTSERTTNIPFCFRSISCLVKGKFKLMYNIPKDSYELYDLATDFKEEHNIVDKYPELVKEMSEQIAEFMNSAKNSYYGKDYDDCSFTPVGTWSVGNVSTGKSKKKKNN